VTTRTVSGARVLVATPSPWSDTLRRLVVEIGQAAGLAVSDAYQAEGRPSDKSALLVCANASGLEPSHSVRMAVILGDASRAPEMLRASLGVNEIDSLRHASNCYAFAATLAENGAGLAIRESDFREEPGEALTAVLAELGLTPAPAELRAIVGRLNQMMEERPVGQGALEGDHLAEDALAMYHPAQDGEPARAWWPRELFRWSDHPEIPPPESIDITGVARSLIVGPYLSLSAGLWRVTAILDLDTEAARRIFLFSFGSGENFTHHQTMGLHHGRNQITLEHHFTAPGLAEFAIGFPFGAFDGVLQFRGLIVDRAQAPA
jgi:hypothetical protein